MAEELRYPPMSREQRDGHAHKAWALRDEARAWRERLDRDMAGVLDHEAEQHEALVAAWDAAVPGVVDSSWAAQVRDLLEDAFPIDCTERVLRVVKALRIARAAAGGEAAAERRSVGSAEVEADRVGASADDGGGDAESGSLSNPTRRSAAAGDCPFCEYAGPSEIVHDYGDVFVIEPIAPVAPGHLLVIPRRHVEHFGADPILSARVMADAARLIGESGEWNVITSIGGHASQTVRHFHVHVVPRREGDGLALPWSAGGERPSVSLREVVEAAEELYDNRLGWSDGRSPYAPPEFWDALGRALGKSEGAG